MLLVKSSHTHTASAQQSPPTVAMVASIFLLSSCFAMLSLLKCIKVLRGTSLCAENTVACIAEARHDITVFVQLFIQRGQVNVHVRVGGLQALQPFRAPIMPINLMLFAPRFLICVMASMALPPVASIGSSTMTSRSAMSLGSLQ